MSITVIHPGILTTIQDLGRHGYQKYGIIVGGAMDTYSLRLANVLVGNKEDEAGLEITLMGPSLEIEKDTLLAITGGDLSPTIDGKPVPMRRPVYLHKKSILKFGTCKSGCRSYLAVAGGYDIPKVMESKSTYLRAGIGGFKGRGLQKGDMIEVKAPNKECLKIINNLSKKDLSNAFSYSSWYLKREYNIKESQNIKIRVIADRQFHQFTLESKKQFLTSPFKITSQSDRMGYRLAGATLKLEKPLEMISEAVSLGTIQVPADGNPIILLADRQTVGGYPKIAQAVAIDISKVVQSKPGDKISFEEISLKEAERLYIEREKYIQNLITAINVVIQSLV